MIEQSRFIGTPDQWTKNQNHVRNLRVTPATLTTDTGNKVFGATIMRRGHIVAVLTSSDALSLADALVDASEARP